MLAYLRLMRISNIFTVVADVTAAVLIAQGSLENWPAFVGILIASGMLYSAGMVLNDLFDIQQDSVERPNRPIPSGKVSPQAARRLGWGLLIAGVVVAVGVGYQFGESSGVLKWRTALLALSLAVTIVAYDRWLKRIWLGPVAMGACRTLNILMAASVMEVYCWYEFPPAVWAVALGMGIYIAGVTWFARTEAKLSARSGLIGGAIVMALGFATLGTAVFIDPGWQANLGARNPWFWPGLLALIGVTVLRRCLVAINDPGPQVVQIAVKQAILTLIVIDASICLFAQPSKIYYALFVLTLLAPTLWLGRWIRNT